MVRPRTVSDEQILDTARRRFLEHGPSVSTEAIASELGVSAQALLKRFQSKQELLLRSVLPPAEASWVPLVAAGPDERPVRDQLTEIVHALAGYFSDITRRMAVLQFSGFDPSELRRRYEEPPPMRSLRTLAGWFERAAARGLVRAVDYEVAAMTVLSAMHGPAMLTRMLGHRPTGHSRTAYVNAVVELILGGLEENAVAGVENVSATR